jgi:Tfp pilus assembly protein PilV
VKQSGLAMVEALVAAGLLGLGLLGASRLTLYALDAARQNRAQEQAQALAGQALACATAQASPCPASVVVSQQGVRYTIELQSRPVAARLTEWQVQVAWPTDAQDSTTEHRLRWRTLHSELPDWLGLSLP